MRALRSATTRSMRLSNSRLATRLMSTTSRSAPKARAQCMCASLVATIGADAHVNTFVFNTGGALVRNQLFLTLNKSGATLRVGGASLLKGRQHADLTLLLDHASGGCQSREVFKTVLDERAPRCFPGPDYRASSRTEDRRPHDEPCFAAVRRCGGRQQARAGDIRRRRAVRPWRDRRMRSTTI